ncbi:uncharacterized protein LOC119075806 [Bradysia coprophila]|uniref:uncharacterized protein LOC119075806 n=1 Tax=Bradysia coprophila TaxID=38358 RepID=UPI00187DBA60|nr:uncharacterized protein LOC119075806 [Bradysia coprophila]
MAGRFIVCFVAAFALIQPFNSLPAAEHKPHEVIYRNSKGEYYTSDGTILSDQYPIYFRQNAQEPKKDHVVIVEPTVTYTRQAEYTSTQASPATTTFRASPQESQANFRPYHGGAETASTVAYYPYYIRAASSSQSDTSNRVVVDVADPSYQRFVPRDQAVRDERGQSQTYYYYSDGRTQTSSQAPPSLPPPPPPPQPTIASRSSVRFYFPNGTAINTYYTQDNKQVMDIHPNQYLIQVTELTTTTTTPRPTTTDCPPYPHPCNTVVYQQTTQCCKCYLVPSRCCPCTYPNQKK